jgi:RNA polymerase sigma-70 factor (ECF subfamily)
MLRARGRRREVPLDDAVPEPIAGRTPGADPADEAVLAESVGAAMLVVLDRLAPAERLAFVLHDMFSVPFEEIAELLERSPAAARQLASRARRRVKGVPAPDADVQRQREVASAYLAAVRGQDFDRLLTLLHPDVLLRADALVGRTARPVHVRGATAVATRAMAAVARAVVAAPALVNGTVGLVATSRGQLAIALVMTYDHATITRIDVVAEPQHLAALDVGVLA